MKLVLLLSRGPPQGTIDLQALEQHQWLSSPLGGDTDALRGELVRHVDRLDEDLVSRFDGAGVADEVLCEPGDAWIDHDLSSDGGD